MKPNIVCIDNAEASVRDARQGNFRALTRRLEMHGAGDGKLDDFLVDLVNGKVKPPKNVGRPPDEVRKKQIAFFVYLHQRLLPEQGTAGAIRSAQDYFDLSDRYVYKVLSEHPREEFEVDGNEIVVEWDSPAEHLVRHLLLHSSH
jgi:hypothetical protein